MSFPQTPPAHLALPANPSPAFDTPQEPSVQKQLPIAASVPDNKLISVFSIRNTKSEVVTCNIPAYGNSFPKQKENPGEFTHITNTDGSITSFLDNARLSKSVYNPMGSDSDQAVKGGHNHNVITQLWQQKVATITGGQFNGKQLSVYYTLPEDGTPPQLKLCPNDFVTVSVARSRAADKPTDLPLRDHYNCGVIIGFQTSDGYLVYSTKKDKSTFPGGFILGDKSQTTDESIADTLEPIRNGEKTFTHLVKETALKEASEEILKMDIESEDVEIIGLMGEQFTYPSKSQKNNLKTTFCIKSIGVLIKSPLTMDALIQARGANAPVDAHELPEVLFVSVEDIRNHPEQSNNYVLEHNNFYHLMNEYFTENQQV